MLSYFNELFICAAEINKTQTKQQVSKNSTAFKTINACRPLMLD